ncbi:MAG TPA: hypothetical protein VJT70_05360 [Sphingomicrobium sp.]|nr:hypothetical protein [Sphingomicrobium sp.]
MRRFVFAAFAVTAACSGPRDKPEQGNAAERPATPAPKPVIVTENVLDREGVILATFRTATAAALGNDDRAAQQALNGRKFAVRLRFACPGMSDPTRSAAYDAKQQVLRVKVQSDLTGDKLPASDLLRRDYEGAVGFMFGKPWLLAAGCPSPAFSAMSSAEPTIVLAQLFTAEESRAQRPVATYQLTKAVKPEDAPQQGLDLVLSGRLAELSDGRPIHCAAADGPPACIVSGRIDRVAIEDPQNGEVLGQWGLGAGAR